MAKQKRARYYYKLNYWSSVTVSIPCTCEAKHSNFWADFSIKDGDLNYMSYCAFFGFLPKPVDLKFLIKEEHGKHAIKFVQKYISFVKQYTKSKGDCLVVRIAEHLVRL